MELKKYKLGEFVQSYGDGIHGTPEYNESGEYYFINGNNLETGKIVITDNTLRITETEYQKIKRLIVKGKTILVSINGTLGRYAIYNGEEISLGKSACFLNLKDAKDVPFILTVVKAKEFTSYLERIAGQSTIKNVSPTQVINYEFYAPALYENCLKNSTFLLKLDRKIELNRLINQNLEAMAKQLYDYWFVQFDFPNEEGKPYKSSGGEMVWNEKLKRKIPNEWDNCKLKDFINLFDSKRIPLSSKDREERKGNYPYYGATGIMDYVNEYIFDGDYILLAEDGSTSDSKGFPIVQYIWGKNWVNNHAHIILPKNEQYLMFTYQMLRSIPAKQIETGSIQKKISQENLCEYNMVLPNSILIEKYESIISPLWEKRKLCIEEINALIKQRDELLPLLMNGQASVNSDLSAY